MFFIIKIFFLNYIYVQHTLNKLYKRKYSLYLSSNVKNSLIADGCVIDGTVENSIVFRGARIAKGAVVKNCIVMQDSYISEGAQIENVIADKLVVLRPNKRLAGASTYPVYIGKDIVI